MFVILNHYLVLYDDDIVLASNAAGLLHEIKQILSMTFETRDLRMSFILIIETHKVRSRSRLSLPQNACIDRVL